jgi:hypothetical protein
MIAGSLVKFDSIVEIQQHSLKMQHKKFACLIRISGRPKIKPGGLDVETNRDRDRERPSCRD